MTDRKINSQLISVPFNADSSNGMKHYNGIAKFSPAGIVFEFESRLLGLIGGEVKEVRVALDEILDIRFRKGIYKFFAQIQLRLKNYTKISALPNNEGRIKLSVRREDFELARRAVEQTLQFINGAEPPLLRDETDANEQLPPAPTSVNELFDTEKLDKQIQEK